MVSDKIHYNKAQIEEFCGQLAGHGRNLEDQAVAMKKAVQHFENVWQGTGRDEFVAAHGRWNKEFDGVQEIVREIAKSTQSAVDSMFGADAKVAGMFSGL